MFQFEWIAAPKSASTNDNKLNVLLLFTLFLFLLYQMEIDEVAVCASVCGWASVEMENIRKLYRALSSIILHGFSHAKFLWII